jgi:hypothetical protein
MYNFLSQEKRSQIVLDYLQLLQNIAQVEHRLTVIYSDPNTADPQTASQSVRQELEALKVQQSNLEPLAESILQSQISAVLAEVNLAQGGQPIPPVLYHTTHPPYGLIVSPRDVIRQDEHISISPDLSVDEHVALEEKIDQALNVSSLVVGIGGIGLYPTMVMQTTDINWLMEVVAHEWIHNYLTLRPLGANYESSPELRTMNETAASIAGKEIGRAVIEKYYPAFLPPPPTPSVPQDSPAPSSEPVFNYNAEMRETRVNVDRMLAAGEIEEAEEYMETRRRFFWENGYLIRKINQAFFAFYGAYADEPGGVAGEDPVGGSVRSLRSNSRSLDEFINRIAWMWSYQQLQAAVSESPPSP